MIFSLSIINVMKKINYFIANTPFHIFVTEQIISQFFPKDQNKIIITVNHKTIIKKSHYIIIRRGVKTLLDVFSLKRHIEKNINSAFFFVPHFSNLLSQLFLKYSGKYFRPISVYYEGVALFYNSNVYVSFPTYFKRSLLGFFFGLFYKKDMLLYPDYICSNIECYSPIIDTYLKFLKVNKINFPTHKLKKGEDILFLTSNVVDAELFSSIKSYFEGLEKNSDIYIKPHYELSFDSVNKIVELLESVDFRNVYLLDKFAPIESLWKDLKLKGIVSQHYSSALINFRCIYGYDLPILILEKVYTDRGVFGELASRFHILFYNDGSVI